MDTCITWRHHRATIGTHGTMYISTKMENGIMVATMNATGSEPWGTSRLEHRLCPGMVTELSEVLDEIERNSAVKGFLLRGEGKFWSNGIDLGWMKGKSDKERKELQGRIELVLARVLVCGVPTVAELNGHTAAAGAMLALAFDERIMREDRGFFFVPAVNIGLTYTPGMTALMVAKTPQAMHNPMIAQAQKYTPQELLSHSVVAQTHPLPSLHRLAVQFTHELCDRRKPYPTLRQTMAAIKVNLYKDAYRLLSESGPDMGFSKL